MIGRGETFEVVEFSINYIFNNKKVSVGSFENLLKRKSDKSGNSEIQLPKNLITKLILKISINITPQYPAMQMQMSGKLFRQISLKYSNIKY